MCKPGLWAYLPFLTALVMSCGDDRSTDSLGGSSLDPITASGGDNPIVLAFGETKVLPSENIEITFESLIHDSRCPIGVDCFWPGIASVNLLAVMPAADSHRVTVSIYGGDPQVSFPHLLPVDTLGYRFTLMDLSPYPVYEEQIPDDAYVATLSVHRFVPNDSLDGEVQITDLPPVSIQVDNFLLNTASVCGDVIDLSVSYSGGCFDHAFSLYMSPAAFLESYPVQANLYIRHYANDDPCDAFITRDLLFDLRPIAQLYKLMYGASDPIVLNVYQYFESEPDEKLSIIYYPRYRSDPTLEGVFAGQWIKDGVFSSQGRLEGLWMDLDGVPIGHLSGDFWRHDWSIGHYRGEVTDLCTDQATMHLNGTWFYDDPRMCPMCGEDHGRISGQLTSLNGDVIGVIVGEFGYPPEIAQTNLPLQGTWRLRCERSTNVHDSE